MIGMKDYEDYTSSWGWTRERSRYHFDYTRQDQPGEWYFPLGRFANDFHGDVAAALAREKTAITWATRKYSPYYDRPDGTRVQSEMIEQEENDLREAGYSVDLPLTDVVEAAEIGPELTRMYEYFGLIDPWVRLHIQQPGQMFNLHIDKLYGKSDNPDDTARIVVNLADWEPGQFYQYGTYTVSHWRAGDVHTFDWSNVPHATANASRSMRPTLIMTGTKSDRTREILSRSNKDTVHLA